MGKSISVIFGSILLITFFLAGCANKDVALAAYENKNYEKAFKIWQKWGDVGYDSANLKMATLPFLPQTINKKDNFKIKQLKQAYKNGSKKAPLLLEDIYIKHHKYKEAYLWFIKADISLSNHKDIQNHLFLIQTYLKKFSQQIKALQKLENTITSNPYIAYQLGELYTQKGTFYNLKKGLALLTYAYKKDIQKAGIQKALILLYELHKEKEAIALLKEIATYKNSHALLEIGKFFYNKKDQILDRYNQPCIACSFQDGSEFYIQKNKLYKIEKIYIQNNIVPWFQNAYKFGNPKGMFYLIQLDIDENNFNTKKTYSQMDLKKTISYLQNFSNQYNKPKMLLAQIYTKYLFLHKQELAKQIYMQYLHVNTIDALWHLYLYEKQFHPNSKQQNLYLNKLLSYNFQEAKVEKAYLNILQNKQIKSSLHILQNAAKQNNIRALQYLAKLQLQNIISPKKTPCDLYRKICHIKPLNSNNDLNIANLYLQQNNITKAAIIFQYYAQKQIPKAQISLANIYKRFCDDTKYFHYLQKAKEQENKESTFFFDKLVLLGLQKTTKIQDSLQRMKQQALLGNIKAIRVLAQAYTLGLTLNYQPKKALYYYKLLEKYSPQESIKEQLNIYQQININGLYNIQIEKLYTKLITINEKEKITYATYLIKNHDNTKAKTFLSSLTKHKYAQADYLLYTLTHDISYLQYAKTSNNGNLLLSYAQSIKKKKPYTALLYTFRASLCNTPSTGATIYNLMMRINKVSIINNIYKEAKQYPRCILNQ